MESILLHGSLDQSVSPDKSRIRNPRKIQQPFISRPPYEISTPSNIHSMGLLRAPSLPLPHFCPPYSLHQPPQPPLLPLPAAPPRRSTISRGLSCPPANRNSNRTTYHSLNPKKSKSLSRSLKNEEKNLPKRSSQAVTVSSTSPLGLDPKELPKNAAKCFSFDPTGNKYGNANNTSIVEDQVDMLPSSLVFRFSPPPSSLPLPTFSLRPKLSCNAEAAGMDTEATDDLRRLLHLDMPNLQ